MPRSRRAPLNDDPTIDADLAKALEWVKTDGARLAREGDIVAVSAFYHGDAVKLRQRTVGDHWIVRDRRLITKEIERRTDRLIGIAIEAAQERGILNRRGWMQPQRPKIEDIIGTIDDREMRAFAAWPDEKFERILDEARQARVMSRQALLRVERGDSASTYRKVQRVTVHDEATQRRIYQGVVMAMDGIATAVERLGDLHPRIKQEEREQWLEQLAKHRRKLATAVNKLRQPRPQNLPPSSTSL